MKRVFALMVVGGCAGSSAVDQVVQYAADCTSNVCGTNGPNDGVAAFHSVSWSGRRNEAGYSFVGFEKDGVPYQLDVTNGYLRGTARSGPGFPIQITGQALVGGQLLFEGKESSMTIRIAHVGAMTFPVGSPDSIETYVLEYTKDQSDVWNNVCADPATGQVAEPGPDGFGMHAADTILFEGDQIDLGSMTVAVEPDLDWFNIGCAGHVLSKLHLTRNTLAADHATSPQDSFAARQATLKMLVADYCGNGTPFTVTGQRLVWEGGLVHYFEEPDSSEAMWNERGALCLDTPRMAVPTNSDGIAMFPDIDDAIVSHCARPPTCFEVDTTRALRRSGNPAANY